MDVAHFIQRYPPALGGSEAYFARLSRCLAERQHRVNVFTTTALDLTAFWSRSGSTLPVGTESDDQVQVRRYAPWRWPVRRWVLKALSLVPHRLWQCLTLPCNPVCPAMWRDAGQYSGPLDLVHASAFPYAFPLACAWRLARRRKVPFLLTPFLHLGDPADPRDPTRRGYTSGPLRWLLQQADRVFVQTPSEADAVSDLGVPASRIVLQGLGVDPADCTGGDRERARQRWAIAPGEVVIGHLANQSREKGTIDLVLAAQRLWSQGFPVRLVLAGPTMPNFEKFWEETMGMLPPGKVIRLGVLTEADKKDFYAGLDVFALPSRSDSFGLVLLEAWANGKPCVGYRAGGVADVIRHDEDGLLVPCGDVAGLAAVLQALASDLNLRARLGQVGLQKTGREYRWSDKLDLVEQVYLEVFKEKQVAIKAWSRE
jgi:glycosyltransferase involved in cell wall biosynthesis